MPLWLSGSPGISRRDEDWTWGVRAGEVGHSRAGDEGPLGCRDLGVRGGKQSLWQVGLGAARVCSGWRFLVSPAQCSVPSAQCLVFAASYRPTVCSAPTPLPPPLPVLV